MFKKALLGGVAFAALSLGTAGASFAGYDVNARIDALENELRALKSQVDARDAKIEALEAKTTGIENFPKFDGKKLKITSADGKYSMELFGRIQIDASIADQDDLQNGHDIGAGVELRRTRFGLKGKLGGDFEYKIEAGFDAANDSVDLEEAYISYVGWDPAELTVGKFKMPYSLEEQTSSRFISFLERGNNNVFAPGKNLGGGVSFGGDNYGVSVAYMFAGDLVDGSDDGFEEDNGIVARATVAPMFDKKGGSLLHLGLSSYYLSDQDGTARFRQRPGIHNADRLVDTGTIANVDDTWSINPEVAFVAGPFSAQAEYAWTQVGRTNGNSDIDLHGGYVYLSYFLTGESRASTYKAGSGKFDRLKTEGAWEILARVSYLDLEDNGLVAADRGEQTDYTLGLNHYFNPNVRAIVNYVYADVDHPTGATQDEEAHSLGARLAVDF
jgi:phosphate-selective porin OprO/OprP